ncbi:MAG: ATP-binding protein [Ginsengibacter sp.]
MKIQQKKNSKSKGWETLNNHSFDAASCNFVLAFGSSSIFEDASIYQNIQNNYPNADIIMNSTSGDIYDVEVNNETISLTAVCFEKTKIKSSIVQIAEEKNSLEAGRFLATAVDCNKMFHDVLADLGKAISEAGADIRYEPLPVINGYATELKPLFQNLVTNAIKFRKKETSPNIDISVQKKAGYWQFAFKDNGIGIEERDNERIFAIFQRLHTRTEYEGSGIGLSHCRKIVELHKGKIWVESRADEGSTFQFTINQNDN